MICLTVFSRAYFFFFLATAAFQIDIYFRQMLAVLQMVGV